MATNFSSLRAARQTALSKLNEEIKKESTKQGADERFWKLTVDQKTKVGYARFRFLPQIKGEDVPWVRLWNHAFRIGSKWFIENCPTTLGTNRPCPVCKENNKLWNSGVEADKAIARDRKRQMKFISNIFILEDPAHPENVGKVFLYKYGPKIHEKINELINPQFPDQTPTNPFDLWAGADFKLKSSLVKNYQNYDKSEFADVAELFAGDETKKETVWGQEYPLQPFVAESEFKNYNVIEDRFRKVLNGDDEPQTAADAIKAEAATPADAEAVAEELTPAAPSRRRATRTTAPKPVPVATDTSKEGADNIENFFANILND